MHIEEIKTELERVFFGVDFDEYLNFILKHNNTDHNIVCHKHHILPKAIWPQFKSLTIHKWNLARLTPADHIRAHIILYNSTQTHEDFQSVKRLKKFIDSDDLQEKYDAIAKNSRDSLQKQKDAGKNRLYKNCDGTHMNDNMLGVVNKSRIVTQISCDYYNEYKVANNHIKKCDWEIVAVLSPEGQTRLKGKPYTSPTNKRVSVISKEGSTKSMPISEYNLNKRSIVALQEWVPIISDEGLLRSGKTPTEKKNHSKICVFDVEKKTRLFVSKEEYRRGKGQEYILWQTYIKQ